MSGLIRSKPGSRVIKRRLQALHSPGLTFSKLLSVLVSGADAQWSPRDSLPAPISGEIYSCDGLSVCTGFTDGAVGIFDSEGLRLRCRIAPFAYMSPCVPSGSGQVYPLAIAAHPSKANHRALGMSDGAVYVMKPSKAEMWGFSSSREWDPTFQCFNPNSEAPSG